VASRQIRSEVNTPFSSAKAPKQASSPTAIAGTSPAKYQEITTNVKSRSKVKKRRLPKSAQENFAAIAVASSHFAMDDRNSSTLRNRHRRYDDCAVLVGLDVKASAQLLNALPHSTEADSSALR
jgi:hypothetical protein